MEPQTPTGASQDGSSFVSGTNGKNAIFVKSPGCYIKKSAKHPLKVTQLTPNISDKVEEE